MKLSPRRLQVATLVTQGLSDKEIGRRLGITVATVKAHVSAVLLSEQVESREQLIIKLFSQPLKLEPEGPKRCSSCKTNETRRWYGKSAKDRLCLNCYRRQWTDKQRALKRPKVYSMWGDE